MACQLSRHSPTLGKQALQIYKTYLLCQLLILQRMPAEMCWTGCWNPSSPPFVSGRSQTSLNLQIDLYLLEEELAEQ